MRIALISIAGGGGEGVRLAGRGVAWHQLHAALALGCERIICLAEAPSSELAELQRAAESRRAAFHAVAHHRGLAGLVTTGDALLVFAPGVLADPAWLTETLPGRAGIATFPAVAVERGFERIDRDRAWAGVAAIRGDAVEALADLPLDADPISGLLRIALQRGAGDLPVPSRWLEEGLWSRPRTDAEAERYQASWYRRSVPGPPLNRPVDAAAHMAARGLVGRITRQRGWAGALSVIGAICAAGAAVVGIRGFTTAALAALVAGAGVSALGLALARFAAAGTGQPPQIWSNEARRATLDLALIAVAASPAAFGGWQTAFAAAALVAVMRLAQEPEAPPPLRPFADRTLVLLVLLAWAAVDRFAGGAALLATAGLAIRLFWPRWRG